MISVAARCSARIVRVYADLRPCIGGIGQGETVDEHGSVRVVIGEASTDVDQPRHLRHPGAVVHAQRDPEDRTVTVTQRL
jgi:hypothetical protein